MPPEYYAVIGCGPDVGWEVIHVRRDRNAPSGFRTEVVCTVEAQGVRGKEQADRIALCLNQCAAFSSEAIRERGIELRLPATV